MNHKNDDKVFLKDFYLRLCKIRMSEKKQNENIIYRALQLLETTDNYL